MISWLVLFDEENQSDEVKLLQNWSANYNLFLLCFNINRNLGLDENNCPRFLWSIGALHMPFTKDDTDFALKNIKINARETENTGSFFFRRNYPYDDPLSV